MATKKSPAKGKKTVKTNKKSQAPKVRRERTWKDISGRMSVYGNVFNGKNGSKRMAYSTTLSCSDEGDWYNFYFDVKFRKDEAPGVQGAFDIIVKEGFLKLNVSKSGELYPAIMILDYDVAEEEEEEEDEEDEE